MTSVNNRGERLFNYVNRHVSKFVGNLSTCQRILDYGCGDGALTEAFWTRGFKNIVGYDTSVSKQAAFQKRDLPANLYKLYDGALLREPSESVDLLLSWFVFEHIEHPCNALRECIRVTKPSGTIMIYADDYMNSWDGHVKLPIPPLMPRVFIRDYLNVFGLEDRADYLYTSVFSVSINQLSGLAEAFGCEVLYKSRPRECAEFLRAGLFIESPASAVSLAERVKCGEFPELILPPKEDLTLIIRRL
jgi:SAM-dependent methyltransferase